MGDFHVTLILSENGANHSNSGTLQGAPGVRITAAYVRLHTVSFQGQSEMNDLLTMLC